MKKKTFLLLFFIFLLVSLVGLKFYGRNSGSELSHISNIFFNNNIIHLDCVGLPKEEVDVTWRSEEHEKLIIQSGKQVAEIDNDYGPNDFDLKINGKKIAGPGHWKTADWHAHDYLIYIEKEPGGYHVRFCAEGPDYEKTDEHDNNEGKLYGHYIFYGPDGEIKSDFIYSNGAQIQKVK